MRIVFLGLLILSITAFVSAENVRIVEMPDGSVKRLTRAPQSKFNEIEAFDRMMELNGLDGLTYHDVDVSTLPADDRNAWEWDDSSGKVKVNQTKKQDLASAKQKKIDDKASANGKLKALGLTDDEIEALTE